MKKQDVIVLMLGTEPELIHPLLTAVRIELQQSCPLWDIKFIVCSRFHAASTRIPEYPNIEVIQIVNDSDFSMNELKEGSALIAPVIARHPRKPLVSFALRVFDGLTQVEFAKYGIVTQVGALQEAVLLRWRQRPQPKIHLVSSG